MPKTKTVACFDLISRREGFKEVAESTKVSLKGDN